MSPSPHGVRIGFRLAPRLLIACLLLARLARGTAPDRTAVGFPNCPAPPIVPPLEPPGRRRRTDLTGDPELVEIRYEIVGPPPTIFAATRINAIAILGDGCHALVGRRQCKKFDCLGGLSVLRASASGYFDPVQWPYETLVPDSILEVISPPKIASVAADPAERSGHGVVWLVNAHNKLPAGGPVAHWPRSPAKRLLLLGAARHSGDGVITRVVYTRDVHGQPVPVRAAGAVFTGLKVLLATDPHLGWALDVASGKRNGFHVAGVAAQDGLVFLGLRGPVMRDIAFILTLCLRPAKQAGTLAAGRLDSCVRAADGRRYAKLGLDLGGLGIHDLASDRRGGLVILARPVVGNGPARVFLLRGGPVFEEGVILQSDRTAQNGLPRLSALRELSQAEGKVSGIAVRGERFIVVYNQKERQLTNGVAEAQSFPLPSR